MRVVAAAVVALALVVTVPPISARTSRAGAPPHSCTLLTPDDLKLVFGQPWRKPAEQLGGACTFERPTDSKVPNIVVAVLVERKASPKKAKQAFARGKNATAEIAEQIEPIRRLGDEAYLSTILGADVLSLRVKRDLAEIRVHRVDKPGETYRDQVLALGGIVEVKLLSPSPARKPKKAHG
jgi:hypothetical protein